MGLADDYSRALRKEYKMHAVWFPISTNVAVGDYGIFDGGVFKRIGHISQFGVTFTEADTAASSLSLVSEGTTFVRKQGGAKVPVFNEAAANVDASLEIEFKNKSSYFVKAPKLIAKEMVEIQAVSAALKAHKDWSGGLLGWKFVSKVYSATPATVIMTKEGDTSVVIDGTASALAALETGWNASVGVRFQATKQLGLEIRGRSGPIGLELYRTPVFGDAPVPRGLEAAVPQGGPTTPDPDGVRMPTDEDVKDDL